MNASRDPVAAQYEAYPYPPRDPKDETRRLVVGSPSHLAEVRHYGFAGALPAGRPFRVLVAGGGTGDALVMLAQQLAWSGIAADICYLDLSAASRAIAEARIRARGLAGVRFVTGSILDVAELAPGPWDYIDCCGVLHHLPDPAQGLGALVAVMAEAGAIGVMLYGELGRTGVYPLQRALSLMIRDRSPRDSAAFARRLIAALPESNWIRRNPFLVDHLSGEDAALYDLLLHSRDRAYRVPQINELLAGAGLELASWIEPAKYDPATWIAEPEALAVAAMLDDLSRAALAEDISGAMKTHVFYAVRRGRAAQAVARFGDPSLVPVLREIDAGALARTLSKGGHLRLTLDTQKLARPVPPDIAKIVALVDGRRSYADIARTLGAGWDGLRPRAAALFDLLAPLNLLLLRRP